MTQVEENQENLKLYGMHQFLVYADDVRSIKQNTEAVLVASMGAGLEVNAEKTKS